MQNIVAEEILIRVINEAVWINCHVFGGVDDLPVLEVRVESGYGARWSLHRQDKDSDCDKSEVTFRGFLEPQMEDGHKWHWRH